MLINEIEKNQNKKIDWHLFGIARDKLFPIMKQYGVTSFDSATHLRRAWLSLKGNYITKSNEYTAIRVPNVDPYSNEATKREIELLSLFNKFLLNEIDAESVVYAVKKYEQDLVKDGIRPNTAFDKNKNIEKEYLRTLHERPWDNCDCPICKQLGIHTLIFRGNERNMRRGFHNTWVFYKRFKEMMKEEKQNISQTTLTIKN